MLGTASSSEYSSFHQQILAVGHAYCQHILCVIQVVLTHQQPDGAVRAIAPKVLRAPSSSRASCGTLAPLLAAHAQVLGQFGE